MSALTDSPLMPVLDVSDVSKCYSLFDKPSQRLLSFFLPGKRSGQRDFWALNKTSFQLMPGETVGIVGRNGSGKSTLLQLVCGTLTPTTGEITRRGRIAALLELGAGFNPEFTGRENIRLNAAIYGLNKEQIDLRMEDIIAFAEIGDFIDQPVQHYSSGMFVRLAFAVIAHVDADILIIDEALAVGDALFSQKCMRFLEEFKQTGSILFVSHDSGSVTRLCDRAIWLERGEMQMVGPAKDVTESYLEHLYSQQQEVKSVAKDSDVPANAQAEGQVKINAVIADDPWHDSRREFLAASNLRNDLEVAKFETEGNSFGTGLVEIHNVCLRDREGRKLNYALGGDMTVFEIEFSAETDLEQLIAGFLVKNRQGQTLFGDNNYISHIDNPVSVEAGVHYRAQFGLNLPYLHADEYVVSVGIASGTQAQHVQHCWRHDALVFTVGSTHVVHGLVGAHLGFCDITKVGE